MRIVHLVGFVIALALVAGSAYRADACGAWRMTDAEKKLAIIWDISSASIFRDKRRIAAFYLGEPDFHKVVTSRQVIYEIKDGKLRKRGKVIGTIDAASVTIGKHTYTFEFTDEKPMHGGPLPGWTMTVKRDGKVIVESPEAWAICAPMARARHGVEMTKPEQQDAIVKRVALYLAWRHHGL